MDKIVNFDLKMYRRLAVLMLLGLTQLAWGQNALGGAPGDAALFDRYPVGSITTVAIANTALTDAALERTRIDQEFAREQRVCYRKFFVASCLEDIKTEYRVASKKIKNIEIEANTYLRQARADERDAALVEQQAQALADAPRRAEEQKQNAIENAKRVEESTRRTAEADARAQSPTSTPDQRIAEHAKKMQQVRAQQAADAKMHDANVDAYNKKLKASQDRQKEVAAKKAEKTADQAAEQK